MIKYQLPQIYHHLLPKEILSAELEEKLATCDACAMTADKQGKKTPVYQADLKCCTYEPFMPNYLLGAILKQNDSSSPGAKMIREKIKNRNYSLPIGMTASLAYQVNFNHREPEDFGQKRDWLCSYYNKETNNCGIWRNRGAVCTTFFCKSSYGKKGLLFWQNLNDYMTYVEMALMEEALVHLDFSPRQVSGMLDYLNRYEATKAEMKSNVLPEAQAIKLWNGYYEDQPGFFMKCYEIVNGMSKSQFREAIGLIGEEREQLLFESLVKVEQSLT